MPCPFYFLKDSISNLAFLKAKAYNVSIIVKADREFSHFRR